LLYMVTIPTASLQDAETFTGNPEEPTILPHSRETYIETGNTHQPRGAFVWNQNVRNIRGIASSCARAADELRAREVEREEELELLIDDQPVRYGRLPDGSYALHEYAYDWSDNLMDLAKRFIDYRSRTDEIRREREPSGGG